MVSNHEATDNRTMFRKGDEPIPGYRLEKFLGKGQFGEVWKTTAPGGTSAALKFIDLGGKQGIKEFRGVRRVKEIRHANLMPITALWMLDGEGNILGDKLLNAYDPEAKKVGATLQVGDEEAMRAEWLVVAMLLGKKNLADRLEECQAAGHAGIPVEELLRYMEEAAKGLDYLNTPQHDLGEGVVAIQHCDVKPANIMLIGDAAVVCDFGLARVLSDSAATATGMVGSPAYMAPECISKKPGIASDQYSLAISYVELRTSLLPFKEITYLAVVEANRSGDLELSRLTPAEQQVIRKATAVRPDDRYPSTLEMVAALRRAVEGKTSSAAVPSWVWLTAAAVILFALPAIVWLVMTRTKVDPVADNARTATISLQPLDAQVKLNDELQALTADGKLTVKLRPGERVELKAIHPGDYLPLYRQLTWELLQTPEIALQMERNGRWFSKQAADQIAAGDLVAAVKTYKQAILVDPTLESPPAIEWKHHAKPVRTVRASPRSDRIVSAGDDGVVCVWRIEGGQPQPKPQVLSGHDADIESLAMSSDGRWLVTGAWDKQVIAWDLQAGDPVASRVALTGHTGDVMEVKITADTRWIASASADTTVRLWRFVDGRPANSGIQLLGHDVQVVKLEVSSDSQRLISIDSDNKIRRWDLTAPQPEKSGEPLPDAPHQVRATAISLDGNWLITGGKDGKIALLPLQGKGELRVFASVNEPIESLALDASGRQLLVGHADGSIRRWNLAADGTLSNPQSLEHHADAVVALTISSDGSFAISGSWDKSAAYWPLGTAGKSVPLILPSNHGQVLSVTITPDGKWLAASCEDGAVLVWDAVLCRVIQKAIEEMGPRPKSTTEARRQRPSTITTSR